MSTEGSIPTIGLSVTQAQFCDWLKQAGCGACLEYHRGFVAQNIGLQSQKLSETERRELGRVAQCAWEAWKNGLVHLVQRRIGRNSFSYLAIARKPLEIHPDTQTSPTP